MLQHRTRRVARDTFFVASALSLAGAGVAGFAFEHVPMDMVLLQLVFYGAWSCLLGARVGGYIGAAMEEEACGELDMGVTSSMGSILGTLSAGLVGTAVPGLALQMDWRLIFGLCVGVALVHAVLGKVLPLSLVRAPHLDARGALVGEPPERQPLRMRDRLGVLLTVAFGLLLALTLIMALMMGRDLGHPVMMAPMMYGMFGTMLGGLLGGWIAGLLDEHRGHPDHDNPVMVAAMALMAGMMGGMPSGMIGAMMAVMGRTAVGVTVATGVILPVVCWAVVVRGRYRLVRARVGEAPRPPMPASVPIAREVLPVESVGEAILRVRGMTCDACVGKVRRKVGELAGVQEVDVDLANGRVQVRWGEGFGGLEVVRERIVRLGYEVVEA
ncbi:MAG: heavy-metal-associated domain-containing protein [Myxococcota bacterium]